MSSLPEPRIWLEPVRGGYPDPRIFLGLSGLEQMRGIMRGLSVPPPMAHLTGMLPTEMGPGTSVFTMPASGWLLSIPGLVQLGTLAILADGPLGTAVQTILPPATPYTTAELSMSSLRPVSADSGTLIARGRLIHAGRSIALTEVTVEDGRGRLVSHGTSRCFIFPPVIDPPPPRPELEPVPQPVFDTPDPYARPPAGSVVPQEVWNERSGLEVLRACLSGELAPPPIYHLTGLRPVAAEEGSATFVLPASEWLCSPLAKVEGGVIAMLAEVVLAAAAQTTVPPATSFAPLDVKVNFLRPVSPDGRDLVGRGTVIHRGRTIAVATSEVVDGDGKRVAVATGSTMILPGRPWRRDEPVTPVDEQDILVPSPAP